MVYSLLYIRNKTYLKECLPIAQAPESDWFIHTTSCKYIAAQLVVYFIQGAYQRRMVIIINLNKLLINYH